MSMEKVFDAYEEMQARTLLESVPKNFWEPSDEAKHQVRKEFIDQMTAPAKDVNTFHRQLGQSVREGALRMARQVDDWHKEGRYQWKTGDQVYSHKTGKTYEITGYALGGKLKDPKPAYRYARGEEGKDADWERGTFDAEKAHETLKLLTPKS
jgi:hypothetical protein